MIRRALITIASLLIAMPALAGWCRLEYPQNCKPSCEFEPRKVSATQIRYTVIFDCVTTGPEQAPFRQTHNYVIDLKAWPQWSNFYYRDVDDYFSMASDKWAVYCEKGYTWQQ